MSFFKRFFSRTKNQQPDFLEGDIFYSFFEEQFHLYKVLKVDSGGETYHVLSYQPIAGLPAVEDINGLKVFVYHMPIAKTGFKDPVFFTKSKISEADLIGYNEYLRQTENHQELAKIALTYYREALRLTDLHKHKEAIEEYSKAIEVFPAFFEAIDNRAFCKMDLALYGEAVDDFNLSLSVNPGGFAAVFSMGECFLRLGEFDKAKNQFEQALLIDPAYQPAKDFLQKVIEHDKGGM